MCLDTNVKVWKNDGCSTFWKAVCKVLEYVIIVDFTPDLSRVEQTTFLSRYQVLHKSRFEIVKRFLKFVDCSDKKKIQNCLNDY